MQQIDVKLLVTLSKRIDLEKISQKDSTIYSKSDYWKNILVEDSKSDQETRQNAINQSRKFTWVCQKD